MRLYQQVRRNIEKNASLHTIATTITNGYDCQCGETSYILCTSSGDQTEAIELHRSPLNHCETDSTTSSSEINIRLRHYPSFCFNVGGGMGAFVC